MQLDAALAVPTKALVGFSHHLLSRVTLNLGVSAFDGMLNALQKKSFIFKTAQ